MASTREHCQTQYTGQGHGRFWNNSPEDREFPDHGSIERCSAVADTWGMKGEYFELSMKLAAPLFKDVRESGATCVATHCPLAALQITQGTGLEAQHPIRVLAEAYGMDPE